jgi:PKHD-type hydroxylase
MLHNWYFFKNVYSKEECACILDTAKQNINAKYVDRYNSNDVKNLKVDLVETEIFKDKLNNFFNFTNQVNEEIFGFKLFSYKPRTININTYTEKQEYSFHTDSIVGMSDIKLTAILNLSTDSFTGGEFEVFVGNVQRIIEIDEPGSMLIFPSFLYHRVKPVLSGERITMSCWFMGPNWK